MEPLDAAVSTRGQLVLLCVLVGLGIAGNWLERRGL